MEKIHKLLKAKCKEDCLIGVHLMLQQDIKSIVDFFKLYGREDHCALNIQCIAGEIERTYIDIGEEYVLLFLRSTLRLRTKDSIGFKDYFKIISKENFINGVY